MPRLLWRLVVVGVVLAVAAGRWMPAPAAHAGPDATLRLSLPGPTGPHRVGTTSLHLVDDSRADPLAPTPRVRELMVRLWYPAAAQSRQPAAVYVTPGVAGVFVDFLRAVTGVDLPTDLFSFPTHSLQDAHALPGARRPVVLFSHGLGFTAALNTALHEGLASRGYVVAGIDHTFDGPVEFPDGRVEVQKPGLIVDDLLREVRAADLSFVLDQLTALAAGHNPDAENRPLPSARRVHTLPRGGLPTLNRRCELNDADFYAAVIHGRNTSARPASTPGWRSLEYSEIRRLVGNDLELYFDAEPQAPAGLRLV